MRALYETWIERLLPSGARWGEFPPSVGREDVLPWDLPQSDRLLGSNCGTGPGSGRC